METAPKRVPTDDEVMAVIKETISKMAVSIKGAPLDNEITDAALTGVLSTLHRFYVAEPSVGTGAWSMNNNGTTIIARGADMANINDNGDDDSASSDDDSASGDDDSASTIVENDILNAEASTAAIAADMDHVDGATQNQYSGKPVLVMVRGTEFYVHAAIFAQVFPKMTHNPTIPLFIDNFPAEYFHFILKYMYTGNWHDLDFETLDDEEKIDTLFAFADEYSNTRLMAALLQVDKVNIMEDSNLEHVARVYKEGNPDRRFREFFKREFTKNLHHDFCVTQKHQRDKGCVRSDAGCPMFHVQLHLADCPGAFDDVTEALYNMWLIAMGGESEL
ncbi:hypothetical protein A1O1_01881 [Capronia coronata CBS 617.96]|uniref:BTB domain-containing protein n=1 Tax=Capronia coronata CBS 617.96 TaxID=1182541 RepID=W9ZG65_9EURO|nr:uncharacterized protein A1O1_01881 [Capronia coronata CBS 617.96]EXJ93489.1 hypothetical protein A1O1_01881 [Capronia coronata CBS 617.96]